MEGLRQILSQPAALGIWVLVDIVCVVILVRDLRRNNAAMMPIMRLVWALTVAYSGPFGLAIYWFSGRQQIARDSLWRKGFRSTSHCYSGCGLGEIVGVAISVGLFSLGNIAVAIITFSLAYVAGFALTVKPLMDDGESLLQAVKDAAYSETASIAVMEIVAIGVDLGITGNRNLGFGDPLFWNTLIVSLSCGLIAAYPINLLLIHFGFKAGMHDPRHMAQNHHGGEQDESRSQGGARQQRAHSH